MNSIISRLEMIGIIPVAAIDDAADAVPLAQALCEGGLPAAEVTFRTDAAAEAIRRIKEAFPEMTVGAGTVLTAQQADLAADAGAEFIVSPGFSRRTVEHCLELGLPVLPGCSSASDIEAALELGLSEVKFFPAEQLGGLKTIGALAAPYAGVRFMPTGGLGIGNIGAYLSDPRIIACGGSFMVSRELIAAHSFDRIRELTAEAASLMLRLTFGGYVTENGTRLMLMSCPNVMRTVFHMERLGTRSTDRRYDGGRLVSADTADGMRIIQG